MKRNIVVLSSILILFISCSKSSQPTEIQLGTDINGKTAVYISNQKLSIALVAPHADGGWWWFCDIVDTNVVRLDSEIHKYLGPPGSAGGPDLQTFYFRTMNRGLTTINLNECRFQKTSPPIDSVRFAIRVLL